MAKVNLFDDFKELLRSLNSEGVEYLLLGGYAVNHYGYERMTGDIDIWIAVEPDNAKKLSKVLQEFAGFKPAAVRPSMFLKLGKMFTFGVEPYRIDILTAPSGVDFEGCFARRNIVVMDGVKVPLISFADLLANKKASGRLKDLADLAALPETEGEANKPKSARKRRSKR